MQNGDKRFFEAYVTAALWSTTDNADESGGEPLDANYDASDIAEETLEKMRADCRQFQEDNASDLEEYYRQIPEGRDSSGEWTPEAQAGHDFWLSRNGHGAGFFDRDVASELRDRLQDKARQAGEVDLYVGDDGQVWA